jgi:hypothetical protein
MSRLKAMKKKGIKEIDFSKAEPNKLYGRPMVVVGDKRYPRQPDPTGKLFRFVNTRTGRFVDVRAANKAVASVFPLVGHCSILARYRSRY